MCICVIYIYIIWHPKKRNPPNQKVKVCWMAHGPSFPFSENDGIPTNTILPITAQSPTLYSQSAATHPCTISTHREIFSKSYQANPKSDCIYNFLIELDPNGRPFGSNGKSEMVNTIWFRVDLIRFRKDFSVCTLYTINVRVNDAFFLWVLFYNYSWFQRFFLT